MRRSPNGAHIGPICHCDMVRRTYTESTTLSEIGLATVESTLAAIQSKLIGTVLPLAAILGLVFAGSPS